MLIRERGLVASSANTRNAVHQLHSVRSAWTRGSRLLSEDFVVFEFLVRRRELNSGIADPQSCTWPH